MKAEELSAMRRALHQIPELGFSEHKTQAYLLEKIAALPQEFLTVRTWRTGIFLHVEGTNPKRTIGYRADMDALPIHEQTGYEFASTHEGAMHACGHDFHMTIALGVLHHFAYHQPTFNLVFIFQPAEEGPGGAKPILEEDVLGEWRPDEIYSLHIAPELPVGTVSTKPGLLFANTSELFIDLVGKGGHAAYPHTTRDMVVTASHFITQLQTIVSRNVDPLDGAVVTIGVIQGGSKQNVIAERARIEGTVRTRSLKSMDIVKQRLEALVKGVEIGFECEATIDYGSNYCEVNNNAELVMEFQRFSENAERVTYVEAGEAMTGEDFGYFLKEIPGLMFWLGVASPYGLHDNRLAPDEKALELAVNHLIDFFTWKKNAV
ncbi:N-acetyldiaminopimelate deacetylase [Shouchella shacheensis]|uniref:N-acetyldiaminopimelate deacetylase n=1 Tax=Shouchella shacheensis TaxID=1649580 RepID=UPI00073FF831|nr:N-acetyldiaminopimelate deacetylase [Shouchella shacheensis]